MRQLKNILPTEHLTHQKIASYLIAFSWSLKHQLRKTHPGMTLTGCPRYRRGDPRQLDADQPYSAVGRP